MSNVVLPYSMITDQQNQVKANSTHVQGNFDALASGVNSRLDLDGSNSPTADISMASHKLTNLATPTASGDAVTKGYVDSADLLKAPLASPTLTGTPTAPTVSSLTDNSTKLATTEFVLEALKAIYPVDSVYIGTQNTCPMAALFGTWTQIATKIITAVNSSASITGSIGTSGDAKYFVAKTSNFSQSTYPNVGSFGVSVSNNQTIPGASATVSSTELTINIWKRTA